MKRAAATLAARLRSALAAPLRGALARPRDSAPASFMEVERAERIFYLEYLREGMTVFDVGANVGELTLLFSRFVGGAGRVHAFEAGSSAFERLSAVCRAASCANVRLNHLALAEREGTVRLHIYPEEYLSWSTQAARPLADYGIDVQPTGTEETPATTVDLYCERNGVEQIDLLKIDVEGAELQVLRGAQRMLGEKRVGCVTFEFGQTTFDMGNSPDAIEAFVQSVGYKLRNLVKTDPTFPGRAGAQTAVYSMHVATP